jgi:hypothetical protein
MERKAKKKVDQNFNFYEDTALPKSELKNQQLRNLKKAKNVATN